LPGWRGTRDEEDLDLWGSPGELLDCKAVARPEKSGFSDLPQKIVAWNLI
jgi:hypothetical protein